jgi:hypothetical protein
MNAAIQSRFASPSPNQSAGACIFFNSLYRGQQLDKLP